MPENVTRQSNPQLTSGSRLLTKLEIEKIRSNLAKQLKDKYEYSIVLVLGAAAVIGAAGLLLSMMQKKK